MSPGSRVPVAVRVTEARYEADGVRSLVVRRTSGAALPPWEPGAHIDLLLPDSSTRQFSLCGDPGDPACYRIAVLLEPASRGGSRWVHGVAVGDVVHIRPPRNHFALEPATGYTFVAGGIGITPILPMVTHVSRHGGTQWRLHYGGRRRSSMAFTTALAELGDRARILAGDEGHRINLPELVDTLQPGHLLYVCGPTGLVAEAQELAGRAGCANLVRYELFSAPPADDLDAEGAAPFEVELRRSGRILQVPPASSILQMVRAAGVGVISDCEDGICGSCETTILDGRADHRDHVLSPDEQQENRSMMICVSRSKGERLILDL